MVIALIMIVCVCKACCPDFAGLVYEVIVDSESNGSDDSKGVDEENSEVELKGRKKKDLDRLAHSHLNANNTP